jgi:death on curing protein
MAEPQFLSVEDVIDIHADQIERYGGSLGVRDVELLRSAIGMPEAGFGDQYLHADLFEMAAAYLYHIVQNHPFIDGNKRTGAMAAFVFLKLNGFTLDADESAFESLVLKAAQGQTDKSAIAEFLRKHSHQ